MDSSADMQMTGEHLKRCSMSVIIKEIQIKTTMRYNFTPIRMATIKKKISVGKETEKRESSCIV